MHKYIHKYYIFDKYTHIPFYKYLLKQHIDVYYFVIYLYNNIDIQMDFYTKIDKYDDNGNKFYDNTYLYCVIYCINQRKITTLYQNLGVRNIYLYLPIKYLNNYNNSNLVILNYSININL